MSMEDLAQSVYRIANGSRNTATGDQLTNFVSLYRDWANDFISELELEADWIWWRKQDHKFGTASNDDGAALTIPDDFRKLVVNVNRPIYLQHDGTTISTFLVVDPNNVSNPSEVVKEDRVTFIDGKFIFSRPFTDEELGADVYGDYMISAPLITDDDESAIGMIKPYKMLTLGIAKDVSLPDLVQGGISPNIEQRYLKVLEEAKRQNALSSAAEDAALDSYGGIGGIY